MSPLLCRGPIWHPVSALPLRTLWRCGKWYSEHYQRFGKRHSTVTNVEERMQIQWIVITLWFILLLMFNNLAWTRMLPCNMLLNLSLLYILLKNWSNIPYQNKRRILAHGCLPPVKNCKHKNKRFIIMMTIFHHLFVKYRL